MSAQDWRPKRDPWEPVDYDDDVILAIRALKSGVANAGQQMLALEWLEHVCAADDWAFRPGDMRATDLVLGRQYVWAQIEKMFHPALTPKERRAPEQPGRAVRPIERPQKLERPKRKRNQRATS